MKKMRARGISGLTKTLRDDCVHLMRLSRDDLVLQEAFKATLGPLESAESHLACLLEGNIYWDEDGCWAHCIGGPTVGPFETEEEAQRAATERLLDV